MLMDYLHNNPDAVICYHASIMVLKVISNAAFLVLPQARSHTDAIYYLRWTGNNKLKGLVKVLCQTIKNVVASAFEARTGVIYLGGRHGCPMCTACIEMGHPHPNTVTPFETDNSTAHSISTSNIQAKLSKAFDMCYWWIKDRIKQKMFDIIWDAGKLLGGKGNAIRTRSIRTDRRRR